MNHRSLSERIGSVSSDEGDFIIENVKTHTRPKHVGREEAMRSTDELGIIAN